MLSIELKDNHLTLFENYKNKKLILDDKNKKELLKFTFNSFVEEYRNNLKKYNTTQDKNVDNSFIKMKDLFEELHGIYSEYNLEHVKHMCYLLQNDQNEKEITITMTTCKRTDLFKRTVNSFLECCLDLHLVKEWIIVDDNSSKEDRNEMIKLYPFITFILKEEKDKGHVKSMNIIRNTVKTKYLFHLEDDWEFLYKDIYLTKCLDIIKIKPQYGQCLINKNYSEGSSCFETVGGELKSYIKNDFKQTFYFEHQHLEYNEQIQMELHKYIYLRNTSGFKSHYYWPHFSFRVGLTKLSVLNEIGEFENVEHFEMNYALKYVSKGYITTFLDSIYCSHIGRRTCERFDKTKPNAYELNNINQFDINSQEQNSEIKKETEKEKEKNLNEMFKTFVINLKRRPDRLNNFYEKNKHITSILNVNVEEAVDGQKIKLNQKMRRIFHTSDTFFRKGIMGCAFSHMKLWSKLATDDKYDMYLILEDDVLMAKPTEKFLEIIPNEMNNKFSDWDIIYLGNHSKKNLNNNVDKVSIEKYTPAQFMENSYGGIFCYLIHKRGAIKLLTNLISNGMNYAIDWDMCMLDCVNNYFMYPFLAFSDMATELPNNTNDSDIQRSHNRFISSAQDWILDDISNMLELTSNKGILYFDRDNWNEFIYEKFDFDVKSNIIVSNELINKNLLFTNICFTQISSDTTKIIQDLLFKIIQDNIPIYFYTIYERYLVTVPESLYYKYNIKQHFSFINKIDFEYII